MPDPASGDFVGTGRFGFNNQAATRRELVNGGDLLKDRSVPPKKLSRDAFPPDIRPGPTDGAPAWHDEPDKTAHEKGVPQSVDNPSRFDRVARADHNHDFTYPSLGMTQTKGAAPADYVAPYFDAGEGPHPAATPAEPHKRIANWTPKPDYADRIVGGPIEVWTETSVDGGTTWREPVLRAVVPPGSISAEYEVRDVDFDPASYAVEPQVRVYVRPVNHDKDPALKLVRAGVDGKIDEDFLPTAAVRKPLVGVGGGAADVIASTSSLTAFAASYSIPANRLLVGSVIEVELFGILSTDPVPPTLLVAIKVGTLVFVGTAAVTMTAGLTNLGWSARGNIRVLSLGGSGTAEAHGEAHLPTSSTTLQGVPAWNTAALSLDTTIIQVLQPYAQWGTSSASNSIALHTMTVKIFDLGT